MDNSIVSHLSNHQSGSAPSSPSMSQSQQGGQSRQPVSYPSPTSYPSPGLSSSQYSYPAPNNQPGNEPYRASPTGSNGSLSLPSMRSLDPLQQQPHQPHMGSPLPPPVAQMAPYFHGNPHPAHQYPNVTSDPSQQNMRYALPAPDNRVMSGGRHKKEIKRRTKTGCLTCRKRRIKCDEAHPACRNCQKSKRECLGYDPIFKQQPGPAPIQPAPSSAPSQLPIAAPSHPYGNQPAMLQAYSAGVPNMGYDPALPADESSPGSTSHPFDYSSAIDPALEAAAPASNANQFQQAAMPGYREDLKRDMHSASPYSSGTDSPHIRGGASSFISPSSSQLTHEDASAYATHPAKGMTIEALLPVMPKNPDFTGDNSQLDEIKHIWYSIYVPGLENFLESKWFTLRGVTDLVQSKDLLNQFAVLLDCFSKTASSDPEAMAYTSGVEARLVWSLLCMVRTSTQPPTGDSVTTNDNVVDARSRLSIFEHLLTGQPATSNPLTKTPHSSTIPHHKQRELDFWHTLGEFVTQMDGPDTKKTDDTLVALRGLLDGRENRDVLYSIAVVRGISNRVAEYSYHDRPLHLDETDQRSKLAVAKQFVKDEADGSGTTNVIRRLCELATRSWTAPRPTLSAQK